MLFGILPDLPDTLSGISSDILSDTSIFIYVYIYLLVYIYIYTISAHRHKQIYVAILFDALSD